MADRVIQRNDTAARWKEVNPVLAMGEIGIETDGAKGYKIGDGVTRWNDLAYPANPTSVVQEGGTSETAVMSQKAVSEKAAQINRLNADLYNNLELSIGGIASDGKLTNDNTRARTSYLSGKFSVKTNNGYIIKYLFSYTIDVRGNLIKSKFSDVNKTEYSSSDINGIYRIVFAKNDGNLFSDEDLYNIVSSFVGKFEIFESERTIVPYNNLYMWEQGSYNVTTQESYVTPNRIRCWMWANTQVKVKDGYTIKFLFYKGDDGNFTYQNILAKSCITDYDGYVVVAKDDDSALTPNNDFLENIESPTKVIDNKIKILEGNVWQQGSVNVNSNNLSDASNRIRCYVTANTKISVKNGYIVRCLFYKGADGNYKYKTPNRRYYVSEENGYVVVAKDDDSALTPNDDFLGLYEYPSKVFIEQLSDFDVAYKPVYDWQQGAILGNGTEVGESSEYYNNRIKTGTYFPSMGEVIVCKCANDFKLRVFSYNSKKEFINYDGELTNGNTFATVSGYFYRFVLLRVDDGNVTIDDGEKCEISGFALDVYSGWKYYKKPTSLAPSVNQTRNNLTGKRVAFLGDSITQGSSASSQENTYHGVFCSLYGAVDRTAEVYAEKGSSSDNLLGMNGTCIADNTKNNLGSKRFVTRATAENFADSKLIVIFGGTNDLSYDRKPIGDLFVKETIAASGNMGTQRLTRPTDTETFAGALHELITTIQNVAPKVPIVFMTPMKRDHNSAANPDYLTCNSNGDFMIDYVNAIKEICAFYSIPVLDMYSNSQLNPLAHGWSSLFGDGLHPNNEGHRIIGELLFRFVEENVIVI